MRAASLDSFVFGGSLDVRVNAEKFCSAACIHPRLDHEI